MPLTGISFATPGIAEFLGTAFKLDKHEFLARMEGFVMQGLKGMSITHLFLAPQPISCRYS